MFAGESGHSNKIRNLKIIDSKIIWE